MLGQARVRTRGGEGWGGYMPWPHVHAMQTVFSSSICHVAGPNTVAGGMPHALKELHVPRRSGSGACGWPGKRA